MTADPVTADTTRPPSGRLPTGWEPDLPLDDTELRRFVHAYAEMLAEPVAACGGRLGAGDGFLAADAGRPAGFFNGAMLLHPPDFERWPEMLACVEAALLGDGAGDVYLWSVRKGRRTGPLAVAGAPVRMVHGSPVGRDLLITDRVDDILL